MSTPTGSALMERLVSLCKRRGFIFQSLRDLRRHQRLLGLRPARRRAEEQPARRLVGRHGAQPAAGPGRRAESRSSGSTARSSAIRGSGRPAATWAASPIPCRPAGSCKKLFRADHVGELLDESEWVTALLATVRRGRRARHVHPAPQRAEALGQEQGQEAGARACRSCGTRRSSPRIGRGRARRRHAARRPVDPDASRAEVRLPCPNCGGDLTEPRQFNLMFETYVGAVRDDESKAYLRPETAQGMFYNFKNVLDSTRVKVPFGICQVGRSFRNEVTPRNYIFRSREFEQMEIEFFFHPSEADRWYRVLAAGALRLVVQPRARGQEPAAARPRAGRAGALREGLRRLLRRRVRLPVLGREGLHRARGHRVPQQLRSHASTSA